MSLSIQQETGVTSQQVAWRLFLTVHALATRRIDSGLLAENCISFDDYDVLLTINEASGETLRMSELAEAVLLSNSGMSRRVARLAERGLLHRDQCAHDGRVFRVRLSKAGRKALENAWLVYRGLIEESFASFVNEDEAVVLGKVFQRILNGIGSDKYQGVLEAQLTDAPKPGPHVASGNGASGK
ncbi:MAG: MarR family transcriptional regulator [Verrucomicrobia bacterium]|nr:MAG: MarR family transcriptional regulator [Verrucomicrobiota bacterium]